MKLSNKTKPKISKYRNYKGAAGYTWDNGAVCFDQKEKGHPRGKSTSHREEVKT